MLIVLVSECSVLRCFVGLLLNLIEIEERTLQRMKTEIDRK